MAYLNHYTEKEASEKWCAFSRIKAAYKDVAINRIHVSDEHGIDNVSSAPIGCACLASKCMHWVWHRRKENDQIKDEYGRCGLVNLPPD